MLMYNLVTSNVQYATIQQCFYSQYNESNDEKSSVTFYKLLSLK